MAEWQKVTLAEDGARAWRVVLEQQDVSDALVLTGAPASVSVEGGPADVFGTLAPNGAWFPLNDLQGVSLTTRRQCLEGIAEHVYAIRVAGQGTVTVFALRRG